MLWKSADHTDLQYVVQLLSRIQLFATSWITGHQAPLCSGLLVLVHGVFLARILEWIVVSFSSEPCFVRTLHYDRSILGGPAWFSSHFFELCKLLHHKKAVIHEGNIDWLLTLNFQYKEMKVEEAGSRSWFFSFVTPEWGSSFFSWNTRLRRSPKCSLLRICSQFPSCNW